MAGKTLLENLMTSKNHSKNRSNLSILLKQQEQALKEKDQTLKRQAQALKEKDQTLKQYQGAIQKSKKLIKKVTDTLALQLKIAQEIHHVLLPSELPVIPNCEFSFRFQPAQKAGMGKDFYEISPHPRYKSFSLILSSSADHSLSALLFSARLKMMSQVNLGKPFLPEKFINQLREELNVGDFTHTSRPHFLRDIKTDTSSGYDSSLLEINKLKSSKKGTQNRELKNLTTPLYKISFFYALINQKTYQLLYALTGGIVALIYYTEREEIKKLKPSAGSLEIRGKTQSVDLNARDRLIVLSPGVFQTRSLEGKQYTLSKIKKILKEEKASSVHEIRNRIFYDLKAFSKGRPSESDQSVLVMEVKQRILKLAT